MTFIQNSKPIVLYMHHCHWFYIHFFADEAPVISRGKKRSHEEEPQDFS